MALYDVRKVLYMTVTEDDDRLIHRLADADALSVAEWLRRAVNGHLRQRGVPVLQMIGRPRKKGTPMESAA